MVDVSFGGPEEGPFVGVVLPTGSPCGREPSAPTLSAAAAAGSAAVPGGSHRAQLDAVEDCAGSKQCQVDVFSFPDSLWLGPRCVTVTPATLVADVTADLARAFPTDEGVERLLLTGQGELVSGAAAVLGRDADGRRPFLVAVQRAPVHQMATELLGEGRFGTVRAAYVPGLGQVAVKVSRACDGAIPAEMRIACQILAGAHRNRLADLRPPLTLLMPLGLCFKRASPDCIYVAYPRCEPKDGVDAIVAALKARAASADPSGTVLITGHAMSMAASMLDAAVWLGACGFVHSDFKPDNVLWRRWADVGQRAPAWPGGTEPCRPWHFVLGTDLFAVVGDLGGVSPLQRRCGPHGGTQAYWAPERAGRDPYCPFRADLYSIGKAAIGALTGTLWEHAHLLVQAKAVVAQLLAQPQVPAAPLHRAFGALLLRLTATNPQARWIGCADWMRLWLPRLPPLPAAEQPRGPLPPPTGGTRDHKQSIVGRF